ncbi:hypothetical protein D1O33_17115 [Rhodococcus rhodochrous]|nr:hypothetical protein D1O33_17115 [Rhodococcus rhodochrous]QOH56830.1 hypothetical protein C6Y44_13350 [Rhodococcus rhodochrous]
MSGQIRLGSRRPFTAVQLLAPRTGFIGAATTRIGRASVAGYDRFTAGHDHRLAGPRATDPVWWLLRVDGDGARDSPEDQQSGQAGRRRVNEQAQFRRVGLSLARQAGGDATHEERCRR